MTQEEKQLLLKDLCARLPYHTYVEWDDGYAWLSIDRFNMIACNHFGDEWPRPYLRPLSSMTEEEKRFIDNIVGQTRDCCGIFRNYIWLSEAKDVTDFYCSHHLDHRGLIPMGLAIEAPKDMYNK